VSKEAQPRIIVGISGASGIVYGIEALKALRELDIETHLVVSKSALVTLSQETDMKPSELTSLADHHYANADIGAAISSGSFQCQLPSSGLPPTPAIPALFRSPFTLPFMPTLNIVQTEVRSTINVCNPTAETCFELKPNRLF